jgi:photosystem II stability/assembly factor-like uncharacterized protein
VLLACCGAVWVLVAACGTSPSTDGAGPAPTASAPTSSAATPLRTEPHPGTHRAQELTTTRPQRTFVATSREAFVLARTGAGRSRLYRTTDRGLHVEPTAVPSVFARDGTPLQVVDLVFSDQRHGIAMVGGAHGRRALETTSDGGRSWTRDDLPAGRNSASAVAGHGARRYAVSARGGPCTCRAVLYTQGVGATRWRRVAALPREAQDGRIGLAAWGPSVWVTLGVGTSRQPVSLFSSDGGVTFRRAPALSCVWARLRATSRDRAWVDCGTGMLVGFEAYDGATLRRLPIGGSGTANTVLDPLSDTVAVFGTESFHPGVSVTTDGGRHFTRVARFPHLAPTACSVDLAFFDTRAGLATVFGRAVYRTSDRGRTWHRVHL